MSRLDDIRAALRDVIDVRGISVYEETEISALAEAALRAAGCTNDWVEPQKALCASCTVEDDPESAAERARRISAVPIPLASQILRSLLAMGDDPDPDGPPLKPRPRTTTEKMRGQRVIGGYVDEAVGMLDARYEPQDPTL